MGKTLPALIVLVLGASMILCTHAMIRFQVWTQRVIAGAEFVPSKRTYTRMRILGVLLLALSFAVAFLIHK